MFTFVLIFYELKTHTLFSLSNFYFLISNFTKIKYIIQHIIVIIMVLTKNKHKTEDLE
jgi:hypothetical protein